MASTTNMAMEKQTQQQPQPQQPPALKCPRCDSSNTKFCYYNNYSLSQPRHFCKACKRYWTRGGTLRNVPVGGGCRKNKRVKKPSSATTAIDSSPSSSSAPLVTTNPSGHSQMDHINPLFYGLHSNLSFPRFNNNSRVHDNSAQVYEYDLDQPQVNGLGFSSSGLMTSAHDVTSKSLLLNHPLAPIFGSLNSSTISASASDSPNLNMASLIASNLQQHQKFMPGGGSRDNTRGANNFHGFSPYEDHMQMQGNNLMEQIGEISSDPNSLFWNATGVGANWLDPTNIGSSVPSLI